MPWCIICSVPSPTGQRAPGIPCLRGQPVPPESEGARHQEGPEHWSAWSRDSRSTWLTLAVDWRAAESGWGKPATRHLHHAVGVFQDEHGQLPEGCQGERAGGKGDPNDTPRPQAVADGAEESEDGKAVYTRTRTDGEGPSPLEGRRTKSRRHTKYPANA